MVTKENNMQLEKKPTRLVKRRATKLSDKQMTDQSFKKSCDINNIVKQFAKTGILPNSTKIPQYGDYGELPTLETAFEVAHAAQDAFYALPSTIRKLIDNDPSKLELFVSDEANKEICLKYGLLEKKPQVIQPSIDEPKVSDLASGKKDNKNEPNSKETN